MARGTVYVQGESVRLFRDFTPYPRWVLRSGKLSSDETAFFLWLISHDEDYEATKDEAIAAFPNFNPKRYERVTKRLTDLGILTRLQDNRRDGTFKPLQFVVHIPTPEQVAAWP